MAEHRAAGRQQPERSLLDRIDLVSLGVLFIAILAAALILVGIAVRGSAPWLLIGPALLGFFAIIELRR